MQYDFGGGTFDISILEVGEGVVEVKATNGDTHLGGDNLDQRVIEWIVSEFKKSDGIDPSKDRMAPSAPLSAAEKAAMEPRPSCRATSTCRSSRLTRLTQAPDDAADAGEVRIARRGSAQKTVQPVKQALQDAGVQPKDIDEVVCRRFDAHPACPKRQIVKDLFGKEPHKGVNPDEVVAVGAAIRKVSAGEAKDLLLLDVTPLSLGIETLGGVMTTLIPRNTTIPTRKSEIFPTAADGQTSVEVSPCG